MLIASGVGAAAVTSAGLVGVGPAAPWLAAQVDSAGEQGANGAASGGIAASPGAGRVDPGDRGDRGDPGEVPHQPMVPTSPRLPHATLPPFTVPPEHTVAVPEPASLMLLTVGTAAVILVAFGLRRRRNASRRGA